MHILFCRHIWAELSLLYWTFLSGTFFPGGGGGDARAPSVPPPAYAPELNIIVSNALFSYAAFKQHSFKFGFCNMDC